MRVRWTPEAQHDRVAIWDHIEPQNAAAAIRMDLLFSDSIAKLADFPMLGRPGIITGTRELTPHRSYRLVYEISEDTVWVLAIVHTARQWPPLLIDDRSRSN